MKPDPVRALIAVRFPVSVGISVEEVFFVIVVAGSGHVHRLDVVFHVGQVDVVAAAFVVQETLQRFVTFTSTRGTKKTVRAKRRVWVYGKGDKVR